MLDYVTQLQDFLQALQRTQSAAEAFAQLYQTAQQYGLRGAVYSNAYVQQPLHAGDHAVTAWIQHYMEQGYIDIDPPSVNARQNHLPQTWIAYQNLPHYTPAQRRIYQEIGEFGLEQGTDIVVPDPLGDGALCFYYGAEHRDAHSLHVTGLTYLATLYTHEHLRHLYTATNKTPPTISPRERDCLGWLSEGLNAPEIAIQLGLSERTVHFHLTNARHKLEASNLPQAVAKAIRLKLL